MNTAPVNATSTPRVLPEESPSGTNHAPATDLGSILDVTSILFAVQLQQQHAQETQHEVAIRAHASEVQQALEQARRAAEEARAQAEESSKWGNLASAAKMVASVAAVAAGVAGAVGTGGLSVAGSLALAGALLSVSAKPIAQAFGGGDKEAFLIGLAGAGVGLGAGAAGLLWGGATALTFTGARTGQAVAYGVESAATGVEGYGDIRAGIARADGTRAEADGIEARAHQRITQRELESLIEGLQELGKSFARAKDTLLDNQRQIGQTNHVLIATLGR